MDRWLDGRVVSLDNEIAVYLRDVSQQRRRDDQLVAHRRNPEILTRINGNIVTGQVSEGEGEGDNYWIDSDDSIDRIRVFYNDYGYLDVYIAEPTGYYKTIGLKRDRNPDWPGYDYTIDINGDGKSHWRYFDDDQDSISASW